MQVLLLLASLSAGGVGVVVSGDPGRGTAALQRLSRDADGIAVYLLSKSDRFRTLFKSTRREDAQSFMDSIGPLERGWACACMPPYEVEFLQRGKRIGSVWLQESLLLYVSGVQGSLQPKNAEALAYWFAARDVLDPLEEVRWMNDIRITDSRAAGAVPPAMREAWKLGGTLVQERYRNLYPTPRERILSLLTWYGASSGPYSANFHGAAMLEDMLLKERTADLVAAFKTPLTKEQMHGAARLASQRVLPKPETPPGQPPYRWTLWDSIVAEARSYIPGHKPPAIEWPKAQPDRAPVYEREVNRAWLRIVPQALRTPHVPTDPVTDLVTALPSEVRAQLLLHVAITGRKADLPDARRNLE